MKNVFYKNKLLTNPNENFLTNHNLFSLRIYQKNGEHKHFSKEISFRFFFYSKT